MSESTPLSNGEIIEDRKDRLIRIGRDLYKDTIPIYSVNIHKLKRNGKTISISLATMRAAFKDQFPHVKFISIESWPMTYKVYLPSSEFVKYLDKHMLIIDNISCFIYVQEPINGVVVYISQIPSTWQNSHVLTFFSEFGKITSSSKEKAVDDSLDTTAIVVFEKAPEFMIENFNIKVDESFPAIKWRFASKATCRNCSTIGHYQSQCPYPTGVIPEVLVKKSIQSAKSKLAVSNKKSQNKSINKGFENSQEVEKELYNVEEAFKPAVRPVRKNVLHVLKYTPTNKKVEDVPSLATNYYATIEEKSDKEMQAFKAKSIETANKEIEAEKVKAAKSALEAAKVMPRPTESEPALKKKTLPPAQPKSATESVSKNVASKSSKEPISKPINSSKSDATIVSTLLTRTRSTSNPAPASPDPEITFKSSQTSTKQ